MTDTRSDNETQGDTNNRTQPVPGRAPGKSLYSYESAGITEREGYVPVWLWVVTASLLIWGIYYLVSYWNAPAST